MRKVQPKPILSRALALLMVSLVPAQAQQAAPQAAAPQSKFQVNFINSCRPSEQDVEVMRHALARAADRPRFSSDFEISRGLTTLTGDEARVTGLPADIGTTPSTWVRIRREFPESAPLSDVQYSVSAQAGVASEALALHLRDTRDVMQVSISDAVKGTALEVVKSNTPPDRVQVERFGRGAIVLARCSSIDQSAYEPLFEAAAQILRQYRESMAVKSVVPAELARLPAAKKSKTKEAQPGESKAAVTNH